jgi:hypothetical protein
MEPMKIRNKASSPVSTTPQISYSGDKNKVFGKKLKWMGQGETDS